MNRLISSIIIFLGASSMAMSAGHDQYNWTGAYAGLNLGSIWTGSHLTAN